MNYTALLVAAVVSFIIGMLWYSPMLFGKAYMKATGHHEGGNKGNMAMMMVLQFIFGLVQVRVLSWIFTTQTVVTMQHGLLTALMTWVGFVLITAWTAQLWDAKSSHTAMWISTLCNLVCILVSASILVSI